MINKVLSKWWARIFLVVAVVVGGYYTVNAYVDYQEKHMNYAAFDPFYQCETTPKNARLGTVQLDKFAYLYKPWRNASLTQSQKQDIVQHSQMLALLDDIQVALSEHFSYYNKQLKGDDLLATWRASLPDSMSRWEFHSQLMKTMARFGDGHASVSNRYAYEQLFYFPYTLFRTAQGVVLLNQDKELQYPETPYLTHIDGKPLSHWYELARPYVTDGSDTYVQRKLLKTIRYLSLLRAEGGYAPSDTVILTMASVPPSLQQQGQGIVRQEYAVPLADRQQSSRGPRYNGGMGIPDNIAYIEVPKFVNPEWDDIPETIMTLYGHTLLWWHGNADALILDIRHNGGGNRYFIDKILSRWVQDDHLVNVARVRQSQWNKGQGCTNLYATSESLENRYLQPYDSLTENQKQLADAWHDKTGIARQKQDGFGDWHYFFVHGDKTNIIRPIVVLTSPRNFSAADIFLGGAKGLPHVTIMGTDSSGGSARSRFAKIGEDDGVNKDTYGAYKVFLKFGTIDSRQPDGRYYDGVGVQADVPLPILTLDQIKKRQDPIVQQAVKTLQQKLKQ